MTRKPEPKPESKPTPEAPAAGAARRRGRPPAGASPASTATLGGSREAKRAGTVVLEVIAGLRSTGEGAAALGISSSRYYQLELRALEGMIAALEPRPRRGPRPRPEAALEAVQKERDRLLRELQRSQALVRLAQRSIGLATPTPAGGDRKGAKRRRRRASARGALLVRALREQASEQASEAPPATPSASEGSDQSVA